MSKLTKRILWRSAIAAILCIAIPIIFYVLKFHELPLSTKPADWGPFGDYIGGILNPIISLLTLIVTIVIAITISSIESRNHEETVHNPVKPFFVIGDGYFYSSGNIATELLADTVTYVYNAPTNQPPVFDNPNQPFYLKVYNKGLGIASEVIVSYEVDLTAVKHLLKLDDEKITTKVSEVRTDEDGRNFLTLSIDAEKHFNYKVFMFKIWEKERVGLGAINKDEFVHAVIPTQMIGAFRLHDFLRRIKGNDLEFPPLSVAFNFKNIYGKEMEVRFRVWLFHVHDYIHYSVYRIAQEQQNQQ